MTTLNLRIPAGAPLTAQNHDDNMLRLFGFATLAEMLADEDRDYTFYAAGATVITLAEGYRYEVAASGATDHHLITAADLKLYVLPSDDGSYNLGAFNPAADDATDDFAVFHMAFRRAAGNVLHIPLTTYYLSRFLENSSYIRVMGHGATMRWPTGTYGIVNKSLYSAGLTGQHGRNMTGQAVIDYFAGLVKYSGNVYRPTNSSVTYTSAQLAAGTPGVSAVWTLVRAVETPRDDSVPTWTGSGSYTTVSYDPAHASYFTFQPGTYVIGRTDAAAYLVAETDASDHDEETMFGIKLYTLDPADPDTPVWDQGALSVFEDLTLDGTDPSSADPTNGVDGFRMRSPAKLRNVTIQNFTRHGVNAQAAIPQAIATSPGNWGNTNRGFAYDCVLRYNGDCGWMSRGNDGNANLAYAIEAYGNGRIGIYDNSFLGSTFVGCLTYGNGNGTAAGNTGGRSSVVSHGGNLYEAAFTGAEIVGVPEAQLDLYVATTPGNDEDVWKLIGAGDPSDEFPAWQSGQDSGFYFHGGGLKSTNTNARSTWIGCSSGDDEGGVVMFTAYVVNLGGNQPRFNYGGQVTAINGGQLAMATARLGASDAFTWIRKDADAGDTDSILHFGRTTGTSTFWRMVFNSVGDVEIGHVNTGRAGLIFTNEDTTQTFGTGNPIPQIPYVPRGIIIGDGTNGRRHNTLTAAPTTGEAARGDVVYNRNPSAGGNVGWICVLAGTPGTWKAFGSIAA